METFVVRLWVPDRPGALGAVASRIGAVRGDVVGIDILERGAGRAIDELVVELPEGHLVDLLVAEVSQVDGVDVEDVRPVADSLRDPRLEALETVAVLVSSSTRAEVEARLTEHARTALWADWAVVIDLSQGVVVAVEGDAPPAGWVAAFVEGSRTSARVASGDSGPDDVAWAPLPSAGRALVLGRTGRPFRARERRTVAALARIADVRWQESAERDARRAHPSVAH